MSDQRSIIIFDGNCNFCKSIIEWLQQKDTKKNFDYLTIQSPEARQELRKYGIVFIDLQTVFLLDGKKVLTRSKAIFRIFSTLEWPYKAFAFLGFLPVFFTDFVYRQIAKNRHRLK